jgi:hypothetical protein
MYTPLVPCARCARHARVTEASCPFCGAEIAPNEARARIVPGTTRRLGRAAAFVFGASVAAVACESEVTVSDPGEEASGPSGQTTGVGSTAGGQAGMGGREESTGNIAPVYGVPAVGGAGGEGGAGGASSGDGGGDVPAYGVPPPPD